MRKIRLTESELIGLIRKAINEQIDPEKASQGPQKCRREDERCRQDRAYEKESNRFDKQQEKEMRRAQKQQDKLYTQFNKVALDPNYDLNDEPLSREGRREFEQNFQSFKSSNPTLKDEGKYNAKQIYGVISKYTQKLRANNPQWFLREKLGIDPNKRDLTEKQVYDLLLKKYGSMSEFINQVVLN
jgi:hypothetical protein